MSTTPNEFSRSDRTWGKFGEVIPEYDFEIFNEREIRAGAGILFAIGLSGYVTGLTTGDFRIMQGFAILFLLDMIIRLTISPRYSPVLVTARFAVLRQKPEWVSARPKRFAWWLGVFLALSTCFLMGRVGAPLLLVLTMCGTCLTLLFLETAFGICVGCMLQQKLTRTKPELCPGDSCNYPAGLS